MTTINMIREKIQNWFECRADSERKIYYEGCYGQFQRFLDKFRLRLFIKDPRTMIVLDLGCGTGGHTITLADLGAKCIVSADLSASALRNVQKYAIESGFEERIHIVCCDTLALPFAEQKFGQILFMSVLNHIPEHGNRRKAVLEAYRVLEPTGVLFVEIPMLAPERGLIKRFTEFSQREKWRYFGDYIVYNFSFKDEDIDNLFRSPLVEMIGISGSEEGGYRGITGTLRNLTYRRMIPNWLMTAITLFQMFLINQTVLKRYWRVKRISILRLKSSN